MASPAEAALASLLVVAGCVVRSSTSGIGTYEESRLLRRLFVEMGYNSQVRPVRNATSPLKIYVGLTLLQLLFIDERSQVMKTNVWIQSSWTDYQLTWDPEEFNGIKALRIKSSYVWRPGIVLMNNADGKYEQSYEPNVVLYHYGLLVWIPPAIYKSSCEIDVEFFPFDQQKCELKLASWTYNAEEIQFGWYENRDKAVMQDYVVSGTWDIMSCPGRIENASLHGVRPIRQVVFTLTVRRKTLFFTVNLIIPCIMLAFLCSCVFYLPSDAGEKITLSLSLSFAINVFLLLVFKILPATGKQVPLISKYLIFTSAMNITSILFTVLNNNISNRTPLTHRMPRWVRSLFVVRLPRYLLMRSPVHLIDESQRSYLMHHGCNCNGGGGGAPSNGSMAASKINAQRRDTLSEVLWNNAAKGQVSPEISGSRQARSTTKNHTQSAPTWNCDALAGCECSNSDTLALETKKVVESVIYMAEYRRLLEEDKQVRCEWKFIAAVMDRILLFIYIIVTCNVTVATFVSAPNIFETIDQDSIIRKMEEQLQML